MFLPIQNQIQDRETFDKTSKNLNKQMLEMKS
jgi:hypothetical protein